MADSMQKWRSLLLGFLKNGLVSPFPRRPKGRERERNIHTLVLPKYVVMHAGGSARLRKSSGAAVAAPMLSIVAAPVSPDGTGAEASADSESASFSPSSRESQANAMVGHYAITQAECASIFATFLEYGLADNETTLGGHYGPESNETRAEYRALVDEIQDETYEETGLLPKLGGCQKPLGMSTCAYINYRGCDVYVAAIIGESAFCLDGLYPHN